MYDWPELRWAHDELWQAISAELRAASLPAPDELDRSRPLLQVWTDPGLILSQTCGWPLVSQLAGQVSLIGTPVYDADGCSGGFYSSFIVVRRDEAGSELADYGGRRFARNGSDSLSGYVAFAAAVRDAGLPVPDQGGWVETGSHRESMRAVAGGTADIAAVDAVCWALAYDFDPTIRRRLKVLTRTPMRPGLPLITSAARGPGEIQAIREAVESALTSRQTLEGRRALHLSGFAPFEEAAYAPLRSLLA